MKIDVFWSGRAHLAESPIWSTADAAFYWVDIYAGQVWRHDGAAQAARYWQLDQDVGCIALRAGGGLLAALRDGVYALQLHEDGSHHASLVAAAAHGSSMRFNDGRCDRQGRFWVGSMADRQAATPDFGCLARLSTALEPGGPWRQPLKTSMRIPNGLGFSPDGRRLYFSDSHASQAQVWRCDYEPESGTAGEPRLFIEALATGRPDGAAVDIEGGYWICANDGAAVLRYTPSGRLDRHIALPVRKPTMCAFGDSDLATLLITSMRPADQATELDGALLAIRPGIAGLAETPWQPLHAAP